MVTPTFVRPHGAAAGPRYRPAGRNFTVRRGRFTMADLIDNENPLNTFRSSHNLSAYPGDTLEPRRPMAGRAVRRPHRRRRRQHECRAGGRHERAPGSMCWPLRGRGSLSASASPMPKPARPRCPSRPAGAARPWRRRPGDRHAVSEGAHHLPRCPPWRGDPAVLVAAMPDADARSHAAPMRRAEPIHPAPSPDRHDQRRRLVQPSMLSAWRDSGCRALRPSPTMRCRLR